jgi:hypothetical protein
LNEAGVSVPKKRVLKRARVVYGYDEKEFINYYKGEGPQNLKEKPTKGRRKLITFM